MPDSDNPRFTPAWTQHCLGVFGALAAAGGVVKYFTPNQDEKIALYYLLAGGALLVLRDVKTLSFGDWKIELQERLDKIRDELQSDSAMNMMQPRGASVAGSPAHRARAEFANDRASTEEARPGAESSDENKDPNKRRFGEESERDGLVLEASMKPVGNDSDFVDVKVVVRSLDPSRTRLTGSVDFYLHPTFPLPTRSVPVRNGRAVLNLRAYGAFTIGAVAGANRTQLELDLMSVPGGTRKFYIS